PRPAFRLRGRRRALTVSPPERPSSGTAGEGEGEVRVAVAVIERRGRFLLRQRPPGGHLAGLWEFPGGKLEPDERWEDALAREVREELGVLATARDLIEERTFDYPERRVHLRFYRADLAPDAEPRSLEPDAPLRWASARELLALP